jgi:phenylalanyl-tRNA synthetase beta chain
MGGGDSEVTADTKTIVFESAHFNALSVRRTSKALGLKTEASMRFERGTDPRLPVTAMERACALLEMIGAGTARGTVVDRYPVRIEPTMLRLRRDRISGLLGVSIPDADIRRVLEALGFALRDADGGWDVTVPTRRVDVTREVDLIEEVARHCGFESDPHDVPSAHRGAATGRSADYANEAASLAGDRPGLLGGGDIRLHLDSGSRGVRDGETIVPIKNPLSEAFAVLRPSLLPGLVESAGRNVRRGQRDVQLFEIGNRFTKQSGETQALAFVWTGAGRSQHWSERTREADFFDATSLVSAVADGLDATVIFKPLTTPPSFLVAGQAAEVSAFAKDSPTSAATPVGLVGRLTPDVGELLGLPAEVPAYVAEVAIEPLARFRRTSLKASAPPRFPSVDRDISILVDDTDARAIGARDSPRAWHLSSCRPARVRSLRRQRNP